MLNIPTTVNDPKYRYRMPKMILKIESKGNGIKTNIVNLGEIAVHLRTNAEYILKWFGTEKASSTTFKEAGGKNNTNYIINGDFNEEELRRVLDKFIDKYICCPKCKLPEMHMQVSGDRINGKCDSCPFVGDLDSKHRLAAFIIKKPPVAKSMATGKNIVKVENAVPAVAPTGKGKGKGKKNKKGEEVDTAAELNEQKPEEEEVEEEKEVIVSFDTDQMDFGSAELERFGSYIKEQMLLLKDEDFDIASARIVSKIKPLGLKKPLIAFILFRAFFTVNITKQVAEHAKFYLNLMKKYLCRHLGSSSRTQKSRPSSTSSTCSSKRTRIRITPSFCPPFSIPSPRRAFSARLSSSAGLKVKFRTSKSIFCTTWPGTAISRRQCSPTWSPLKMRRMRTRRRLECLDYV